MARHSGSPLNLRRLVVIVFGLAILAVACSSDPAAESSVTGAATESEDTPAQTVSPTGAPDPTATPAATSTPTLEPTTTPVPKPTPTPTPTPTATPTPTPTPVDTTPVIIQGEGWVTTEADVAQLAAIVEEIHQLEFTSVVKVLVSDDVGEDYAPTFEPFSAEEWYLLRALGLADTQADRDVANQVRRDRIRGLCCRYNDGTQVIVEVEATKLETEAILVHELTHALHTQHPDRFEDTRFETDESPKPYSASIEGVPQFVTFNYLKSSPADELALVTPELPIIRPDMVPLIGPGPARHINFHYATGPAFVDVIFEARGIDGLLALLTTPPLTTEQILFPEKYLSGEAATSVPTPSAPPGIEPKSIGTVGAAMLMFALVDGEGDETARELVAPWAGDRFIVYETVDGVCLVATIEVDTPDAAAALGAALVASLMPTFPDTAVSTAEGETQFELRTCQVSAS